MNFLQKILLYQGGKVRYGTAGTTTTTTLASQGGLLINIDSATGDIAMTTTGWIEDEKYGFYSTTVAGTVSSEFDTAVTRTGAKTLKLSTTNTTGRINCNNTLGATLPDLSKSAIPLKASTKYKISCFVKTTTVATNSADFAITTYNSSATLLTSTFSNKLTGTNDWTLCTVTFTSDATAVWGRLVWQNGVAGNISDAWFDINSMTLEEVIEPVANSLTSSSPSLVSFTAVGSVDNIDQSQLTNTGIVGFDTGARYHAQQFTPTKSKLTGVTMQKHGSILSPTGDMIFRIATDSADSPTSTILASYTMPSATYNAISVGVDFTVNLPCNITAGTKYWLLVNYSISSATDYPRIKSVTPSAYTGGLHKYGSDGVTYGTTYNGDFYFKTLYYKPTTNFKASQNNSTVSISADEDGMLEGQVINLTTGRYSWDMNIGTRLQNIVSDFFSYTPATPYDATFSPANLYTSSSIRLFGATTSAQYILKVSPGLPISTVTVTPTLSVVGTSSTLTVAISTDNVSYTPIGTLLDDNITTTFTTALADGLTEFYLKFYVASGATDVRITGLTIGGTIDVSSLSTLRNYPTNKDIIKQYSTTLGSATTSATYRATKWGFPAIEYYPQGLVGSWNLNGNAIDSSTSGFNGTASGNITYGSDANGTYADINGDYNFVTTLGTLAGIDIGNVMNFTQATDFSWVVKASMITLQPNSASGIFGSTFDCGVNVSNSLGNMFVGLRGSTQEIYTIGTNYWGTRLGEAHIIGFSYKASEAKFYVYLDGVLQNTGGTAGPTTFLTNAWGIGDIYINGGNTSSSRKKVYYANVFNRFLSDTEHATLMEVLTTAEYLDVDTTATGSTVAFSELGASYTTLADGASLAITSTSNPNIFVKANITANRLYVSSNDYVASSDKDGSLRQSVVYQVVQ